MGGIVVMACAAVLVVDTVGALASSRLGFRYQLLAPLSFAVYAASGYLGADAGGHFLAGAAVASVAGAVDATVGWRVSNALTRAEEVDERMEIQVAALVTLLAAAVGGLAGLFA